MIYGNPHDNPEDDQTDRVGLRTLVVSKMWQPTRWPMGRLEMDAERPGVPEMGSGMLFVGRQTRRRGGALQTFWSFEGIDGDGKSVTFKRRGFSLDYQFDPGFTQRPIGQHRKRIQDFIDNYGLQFLDGEPVWPARLKRATGGGRIGARLTDKESEINPMFGVNEWLSLEGSYSYRYLEFALRGLDRGVGQIHDSGSLPGEAPSYPDRNWLKAPLQYMRVGPVYEIIEHYLLSGEGGWPEPVYGALPRGGRGGGLQTSGPLNGASLEPS